MDSKFEKGASDVVTIDRVDSRTIIRADDARLAELGYKSEFRREFSVRMFNVHVKMCF